LARWRACDLDQKRERLNCTAGLGLAGDGFLAIGLRLILKAARGLLAVQKQAGRAGYGLNRLIFASLRPLFGWSGWFLHKGQLGFCSENRLLAGVLTISCKKDKNSVPWVLVESR
jgi:hypothetical protein